jgi:hypothetical protein
MMEQMGSHRWYSLFVAWLVVGIGCAQPGTLRGKTKEHRTGLLLDGVTVIIQDSTLTVLRRISSGPEGRYEFADVPPGSYTMTSEFVGYEHCRLTGIQVSSKTVTFVDVILRKPEARERSGKKNVCNWRRDPRER